MNNPQPYQLFLPTLFTAWEASGHTIDIHRHLQLKQLLDKLPDDLAVEDLKTIIAPILTSDAQTQEAFYEVFDETAKVFNIRYEKHQDWVEPMQNTVNRQALKSKKTATTSSNESFGNSIILWLERRLIGAVIGLGLAVILGGLGIFNTLLHKSNSKPLEIPTQRVYVNANLDIKTEQKVCLSNDLSSNEVDVKPLFEKEDLQFIKIKDEYYSNFSFCITYEPVKAGRETLKYEFCQKGKDCGIVEFTFISNHFGEQKTPVANISEGDYELKSENQPIQQLNAQSNLLDTSFLSISSTNDIRGTTSNIRIGGFSALTREKGFIIGFFTLLVIGLTYFIRYRHRRLLMNQQLNKDDNDLSLTVPNLKDMDFGLPFKETLRAMRKRIDSNFEALDVHKTIRESIHRGGAITFQYTNLTQNQQYLALIDISSSENHRARLNSAYIDLLQESEAPLSYFYFNKTPNRFWNNKYPKGLGLNQLQHKFGDAQLIIFSDGQGFGNEDTFEHWRRKVVLTSIPVNKWYHKEEELEQYYRLLPATPNGLNVLVETLEAVEPKPYRQIYGSTVPKEYRPIQIPKDLPPDELKILLERHFVNYDKKPIDDVLMRWIAACAFPQVLFWDWTVMVGQMLSTPSNNHLTLENIHQLLRLPWFSEGKIPEEARLVLLYWLEKCHPDFLAKLHQQWAYVLGLEQNTPKTDTTAWQNHRIQIILNELHQQPNKKQRNQLESELEQLLQEHHLQDAMVIKYQNQRPSPLDTMVSARFKSLLQRKNKIFWKWRDWTWQIPAISMVVILALLTNFSEPVTTFQFDEYITGLAFATDNQSFVATSGNGQLAVCDVNGRFLQGSEKETENITGLEFSQDGNTILTGTNNGTFAFWDISGAPIYQASPYEKVTNDIAFLPNNPYQVILGFYSNQAILYDLKLNESLVTFNHDHSVTSIDISKDGKFVVTGSRDKTAKLWTIEGKLLQEFTNHPDVIHSVAISPDNQRIITGCRDNTARVFNRDGELLHTLPNHSYDVFKVIFSSDGKQFLTSTQRRAYLWNTQTGKRIRTFRGHLNNIKALAFSNDGQMILTGDDGGKVRLWKIATKSD